MLQRTPGISLFPSLAHIWCLDINDTYINDMRDTQDWIDTYSIAVIAHFLDTHALSMLD